MSKMKHSEKLRVNRDEAQILTLLEGVKNGKARVLVWMIIAEKKYTADCIIKIVKKNSGEMVVAPLKSGQEKFVEIAGNKEKINFYIPSEKILFQAKVKQSHTDYNYVLELPDLITQVERRSYLRLFLEDDIECTLNFKKIVDGVKQRTQSFSKKCYDISAGGASFLLTPSEAKLFDSDEYIPSARVIIGQDWFDVDLKIKNFIKLTPSRQNGLYYPVVKVGCDFKKLSDKDQRFLQDFVFNLVDLEELVGFN